MLLLINILSVGAFAFVFVHYSGAPKILRTLTGRKTVKPFDCERCLAFWTALIFFNIAELNATSVFYAAASAVFAASLFKLTK